MPIATLVRLDRERHLRYDVNALADVESVVGLGVSAMFGTQFMGVTVLRAMLWGGLKWEDPSLTIESVGDLLQTYLEAGGDAEQLAEDVNRALDAAGLGKAAGVKADPKKKKESGASTK